MTVSEFIGKWRGHELKERSAAQEHFIDLCRLVGHPTPAEADRTGESFTFERGAAKATGGEGWADVWKKGFFGWEYKAKYGGLDAAYLQLLRYQGALENPPLLITCDTDRIVVYTHFSNTPTRKIELTHEGLADPGQLAILRAVFHEPDVLRPNKTIQAITEEAAEHITTIAQGLRDRGIPPERVARFLDRVVFCLFAEDVRLLPNKIFTRLVENTQGKPERFRTLASELFAQMATGGDFGADRIDHFNGNLFDTVEALDLTAAELEQLQTVSRLDWSNIDASIFGTLFERALDPDKRTQLGAHYTSREDISAIVDPVVMAPLREKWARVRDHYDELTTSIRTAKDKKWKAAEALMRSFLGDLASVTVLDPACGSGNFLFVTLQKLKDLEKEAIIHSSAYFSFFPQVGPWQLRGIEVNPYAHDLAQMTVWIGHLQWHDRHGMPLHERPILRPMENFELKDAVLDIDGQREPSWPAAHFIVGNPPFLGGKKLRDSLGDTYVEALFNLWQDRVPAEADYCSYWFEKARAQVERGKATRVGLLATQSIRTGANRKVLEGIKNTGDIFFAESDRAWVLDGADVRVSMIGFDNGSETNRLRDGSPASTIHADLSVGLDLTQARPLVANANICFQGPVKVGAFDISFELAESMLAAPNPNGLPNSDVVRPWLNGKGITERNPHKFIIDFGELARSDAAQYELPFSHVETFVKAKRLQNRDRQRRERWWLLGRIGSDFRAAAAPLTHVISTPRVAKHRLFVWMPTTTLPDARLYAFASDDDYLFGVLHSRFHESWSLAKASWHGVGNDPTYASASCFATFPFPDGVDASVAEKVRTASRNLAALRHAWLNPPELVQRQAITFRARLGGPWHHEVQSPDGNGLGTAEFVRFLPLDEDAAKAIKKRTLTKLYNDNPAWLRDAHNLLDEAVAQAYGFVSDISEEASLKELLSLNSKRQHGMLDELSADDDDE